MAGIFINYRRDDVPGATGRLYDHLARRYSKADLFMDVDAMTPGLDFVNQLEQQVSKCDVMLAIIGPNWLCASDESGGRRLDSKVDYLRVEIASALKRNIPVVPVLVDGAAVPAEEDLPEDLKLLARRHGVELRHSRFGVDAEAVVLALDHLLPLWRRRRVRWASQAAFGLGIVALCSTLWTRASQSTASRLLSGPAGPSPSARATTIPEGAPTAGPFDVSGVSVALGDPVAKVRSAYPHANYSLEHQAVLPLDGIRIFFDDNDEAVRSIRLDAPFAGSVHGFQIADPLDEVLRRLGQPYTAPWKFSDNLVYNYYVGDIGVRYDISKAKKITTIFYFQREQ